MSSTIITKKCPSCGETYARDYYANRPSKDNQTKYGSPIILCKKCGSRFIDTDYREPALNGFRDVDKMELSPQTAFYSIVGIIVAILAISSGYMIGGILIAAFCIFIFVDEIRSFKSREKRNEELLAESQKRIENPNYVLLLNKMGYDVPDSALQKALNDVMPEEPVEAEDAHSIRPAEQNEEKYSKTQTALTARDEALQPKSSMPVEEGKQIVHKISKISTEVSTKEVKVRELNDLICGLIPFVKKQGGNLKSAAELADYISKKFHAINTAGKWYFDEVHAEYRYEWCSCSSFSDYYLEGLVYWKIYPIDKIGENEIINNEQLNARNSPFRNKSENFICENPFGLNGLFRIEYIEKQEKTE